MRHLHFHLNNSPGPHFNTGTNNFPDITFGNKGKQNIFQPALAAQ